MCNLVIVFIGCIDIMDITGHFKEKEGPFPESVKEEDPNKNIKRKKKK